MPIVVILSHNVDILRRKRVLHISFAGHYITYNKEKLVLFSFNDRNGLVQIVDYSNSKIGKNLLVN